MQHDPIRFADTRAWLRKADDDVRAAQHAEGAQPPLFSAVVFHCQQAVEKALKAFLTWHDLPFRKTHNLDELGEACLSLEPSLKQIVDRAVPLTPYAWRFRYPGEPEHPTPDEVREALDVAREVVAAIQSRLPADVRE